jgi:ABC-type proline/glycine betaine transport system permease subunit
MFTEHETCENWEDTASQLHGLHWLVHHFGCSALMFSINFMYVSIFLCKHIFTNVKSHMYWDETNKTVNILLGSKLFTMHINIPSKGVPLSVNATYRKALSLM